MLSASTGYIEGLNNLLKALLPVANFCSISISNNGLLCSVVDKSKSCSAYTLLVTNLFSTFEATNDDSITVSLKSLAACLRMYSAWKSSVSKSRVMFQYDDEDDKLRLTCGFENVRSKSELQIYSQDNAADQGPEIDKSSIVVQMIGPGSYIVEVLRVIDKLGTTKLKVSGQQLPIQWLCFEGTGTATGTTFRLTDDSVDTLIVEEPFEYYYDFKNILKLRDSLRSTLQLNIRCDNFGVMNIQMIHEIDEQDYFVDYLFSPLEESS